MVDALFQQELSLEHHQGEVVRPPREMTPKPAIEIVAVCVPAEELFRGLKTTDQGLCVVVHQPRADRLGDAVRGAEGAARGRGVGRAAAGEGEARGVI